MILPKAQDALTTHYSAVSEELRVQDVPESSTYEVFAVFSGSVHSSPPTRPGFLGLVEWAAIAQYPHRIFGDLIPSPPLPSLSPSTALTDVLKQFDETNGCALPVISPSCNFLGVVTRRSALEGFLNAYARAFGLSGRQPFSPLYELNTNNSISGVSHPEEDGIDRRLTCDALSQDILEQLRDLLFVVRLHLSQSKRTSDPEQTKRVSQTTARMVEDSLECLRTHLHHLQLLCG